MVQLSAKKDMAQVVAGLMAEIERSARAGDFVKAEKLRERLIEVSPMALTEIIAAADIIEAEKASGMSHDHLAVWDSLYVDLNMDEKNCLFYSMKKATISANKLIVSQGKPNPRLFFVDSGRLTLFYKKGEEKILLGQLSRGDVVGEDAFFEISNSTLSAVCQTAVKVRYLEKVAIRDWDEKQPGLLQKLHDYCLKNGKMRELLLSKKFEKRQHPRRKVSGEVMAHVLKSDGQRSGAYFRGGLHDISPGGVCFAIRCTKVKTANALLARNLQLIFASDSPERMESAVVTGQVVKVTFHLHNDYSVHVQLAEAMSRDRFEQYSRLLR